MNNHSYLAASFTILLSSVLVSAQLVDSPRKGDPTKPLKIHELQVADQQPKNFRFTRFHTKDKFGRTLNLHVSRPRKPAENSSKIPLVVCIQGSGSHSVFQKIKTKNGDLIASGGPEAVVLREFKDKVRVLVVEKPGVEFLVQQSRPGGAEEGSPEFQQEFTLQRWTEAFNASIIAVRTLPEIASDKMLVLGHSEGGQVACEVAAANDSVTHVAVMAGGGPTQLFDFIQMARSGDMYDPNRTAEERVQDLLSDWKKVLDAPNATDRFVLGHSHLRWSTFLASSPIEAILKSKAKVFVAQGTEDTNSLPASAEVLYAELIARGRDCEYLRIEGGDHAFMLKGDNGKGWTDTNKKAIEWFLKTT